MKLLPAILCEAWLIVMDRLARFFEPMPEISLMDAIRESVERPTSDPGLQRGRAIAEWEVQQIVLGQRRFDA